MKILLDSDGLFGLYVPSDPYHKRATQLGLALAKKQSQFYVTNLVIQETATVLSRKVGQELAVRFVKNLPALGAHTVMVDEQIENMAWELFLKQAKKGTSFVDCANMAVVEHYKLDGILSFDGFYPKNLTNVIL